MIAYFDTSGIVKLFLERRTPRRPAAGHAPPTPSRSPRVALPEAVAAVARRQRRGELPEDAARLLAGDFTTFWRASTIVELDEEHAAHLALRHGLSGLDAVQLAGALTARDAAGEDQLAFVSFDAALNRAAVAEGLIVLEPAG